MENDFQIDEKNFDEVISRAVKQKCYIEVISLVHNYLELHIKSLIANKLISQEKSSDDFIEKIKILQNNQGNFIKYFNDYIEIAFLLSCINKDGYEAIKKFNNNRNKIIHQLLKKEKSYSEIKKIAKEGRTLQLCFTPFKFTENELMEKMQKEWE